MKRAIAVVMLVAVLLSNVSLASAVTSDWVFYGDYTDVTTLKNYSGTYPGMQGLAVGSQYLYAIKINSNDTLATIAMVDKDTGATTWLKDSSDGSVVFSGFDHANDSAGNDQSAFDHIARFPIVFNKILISKQSGCAENDKRI